MTTYLNNRIKSTNKLLKEAIDFDLEIIIDWAGTIDYPYTFLHLLEIKGKYVYFRYTESWETNQESRTQRFNLNDEDHVSDLKFTLTHLSRALRKAIDAYYKIENHEIY